MRAIVIDPAKREVREHDTDGRLKDLQSVVGGNIEAIYLDGWVPELADFHLYLNEEGRMIPEIAVQRWALRGWPEGWLCGPAILLSDDGFGGEAGVSVSVVSVQELVTFL